MEKHELFNSGENLLSSERYHKISQQWRTDTNLEKDSK